MLQHNRLLQYIGLLCLNLSEVHGSAAKQLSVNAFHNLAQIPSYQQNNKEEKVQEKKIALTSFWSPRCQGCFPNVHGERAASVTSYITDGQIAVHICNTNSRSISAGWHRRWHKDHVQIRKLLLAQGSVVPLLISEGSQLQTATRWGAAALRRNRALWRNICIVPCSHAIIIDNTKYVCCAHTHAHTKTQIYIYHRHKS